MALSPIEILKFIEESRPAVWNRAFPSFKDFLRTVYPPEDERLKLTEQPELEDHHYSRFRSRQVPPKIMIEILKLPGVCDRIAKKLLTGTKLFSCATRPDVLSIIDEVHSDLVKNAKSDDLYGSEALFLPKPLTEIKTSLHPHEEAVIRSLVRIMTDEGPSKVVGFTYDQPLGASFLAYVVAGNYLSHHGIQQAYFIRPYPRLTESYLAGEQDFKDPDEAYDAGLNILAAKLKVEMGTRRTAQNILQKLEETCSVLFVLHADLIPSASTQNTMRQLEKSAVSTGPRKTKSVAPICLIGSKNRRFKTLDVGDELRRAASIHTTNGPEITESRFEFFHREWHRFCDFRGYSRPDDVGARIKRARWYYDGLGKHNVWPISIRMRAFLSSNHEVYGYFDPTGGWSRLASTSIADLPPDIRFHLDETVVHARSLPSDRRQPALRALKWVSTSLYWLTDGAVKDLNLHFKKFAKMEAFTKTVAEQTEFFRVQRSHEGSDNIYRADLTLKAVIQQQWMSESLGKVERAKAHYIIAKRLYNARDDRDTLPVEFPLAPHWGRSTIHLLAETVRHLMRACESAEEQEFREEFLPFPKRPFPAPPNNMFKACDPYETVNFCFGVLFWKAMNKNNDHGAFNFHNRKLARQHGLYNLTAELLQLMSRDNILGEPHWALHPDHLPRYLREVAYAQLDLGNLVDAERNFERLIKYATKKQDVIDQINYKLDLIITISAMNKLDLAAAMLDNINVSFLILKKEFDQTAVNVVPDRGQFKGVPRTRAEIERVQKNERIQKLDVRIKARLAHLCYLRGEFAQALDFYRDLTPGAITREVAHVYIATLGATGDPENLQEALKEAGRQHVVTSSKGVHHEALGFRIAKAHALRKIYPPLAESELDLVYQDILEHGCSERTYLAFLLEAGRTVASLDRHARAYSAYLWPCYMRALSEGYLRIAETARRHAIDSLHALQTNILGLAEPDHWTIFLQNDLQGRGFIVPKRGSREADPKYSYDIYGTAMWLPRLSTEAGILDELRKLN